MTLADMAQMASDRCSPERLELFLVDIVAPMMLKIERGEVDINEEFKDNVIKLMIFWLFEGYATGDEDKYVVHAPTQTS